MSAYATLPRRNFDDVLGRVVAECSVGGHHSAILVHRAACPDFDAKFGDFDCDCGPIMVLIHPNDSIHRIIDTIYWKMGQ